MVFLASFAGWSHWGTSWGCTLGVKPFLWKFYGAPFVKWKPYHLSALHFCLILQTMQSYRATQHSEMIWIMLVKVSSIFEHSYVLVCLKMWYSCIPFAFWIWSNIFETLGCLIMSRFKELYLLWSCGNGFLFMQPSIWRYIITDIKIYVVLLQATCWALGC